MSKIFNIGLNKTGTISLTLALKRLGYKANHNNDVNKQMVQTVLEKKFGPPFSEYDAFSDFPLWMYYKELDHLCPNSYFIVTTRSKEKWIQSRIIHVLYNRVFTDLHDPYEWRDINTKVWGEEYDNFHAEVRDYFKGYDRYLEMDITTGDGWDKLCPFIGKEIPKKPFPHSEVSKSTTKLFNIYKKFQLQL
jgi:hypothetical protein